MLLNLSSFMLVMIANYTRKPLAYIDYVSTINMSLSDVYYILILTLSLAYVSQLCNSSYSIIFYSTSYYVHDPYFGRLIGTGRRQWDFMFWMN